MTHTRSPQLFPYWPRFTVLAALLAAAFLWPASALEWSREGIPGGEYWRLLTGHWTHLGLNHLLLNLAGLLVTGLKRWREGRESGSLSSSAGGDAL